MLRCSKNMRERKKEKRQQILFLITSTQFVRLVSRIRFSTGACQANENTISILSLNNNENIISN